MNDTSKYTPKIILFQLYSRERRSNYNVMLKATEDCLVPILEEDAYNDTIQDTSMLKVNILLGYLPIGI